MRGFIAKVVGVLSAVGLTFACAHAYRSIAGVQVGNPGLGMEIVAKHNELAAKVKLNAVPAPLPPASQDGQLAIDAYKNVQVLGHITSGEMTRLMTAMTIWVAPKQGCAYCHAPSRDASGNIVKDEDGNPQADLNNLYSDELYTKRVARRMLQMTMHINSDWKSQHVKETGVTCYTCHRGNPVPAYLWFDSPPNDKVALALGNAAGQNAPSNVAGLSSLPSDVFRPFLADHEGIRVISTLPLPVDNRSSIKQTEWTYGLMMHISGSLGVNCTYCHNTRSMAAWDSSPPARATAWYGIRMVRDINTSYLEPLLSNFPPVRLGPTGDVPKVNCATCHQGAYKPLLGVSMLKDYMVLAEAKPQPQRSAPTPTAPTPTAPTPIAPKAPAPTAPAPNAAPAAPAPKAPAPPTPAPAPKAPAPTPASPASPSP